MSIVLEAGVAMYVALAVALAVWIGLFVYVWKLDTQARELRQQLDQQLSEEPDMQQPATVSLRTQRPDDGVVAPTEPASTGDNKA